MFHVFNDILDITLNRLMQNKNYLVIQTYHSMLCYFKFIVFILFPYIFLCVINTQTLNISMFIQTS